MRRQQYRSTGFHKRLEDGVGKLRPLIGVGRLEHNEIGVSRLLMNKLRHESEARTEEACDAAGEGDVARLDRALERLWVTGMSPIGVVRASLAHFQRLALVKAQASSGGAEAAMRRLRPPVHFKREASFKAQLQRWSAPALDEALNLLLDTEELCKTTAVPAEAVCSRALFQVAARARIRG